MSLRRIKRKQVVRASPDKRIQVARLEFEPTRTSFFVRLSAKMNLDAGEKLSERNPENAMANRYLRALSSKADGINFSLRTTFFSEGKHGQAPTEHFLSCVSFQHVHSVFPESVKAYSFNLNDSSFVGQFLSSFFAFFITPSLRPFSLFFPFYLSQ